jgi:hypothetical protein
VTRVPRRSLTLVSETPLSNPVARVNWGCGIATLDDLMSHLCDFMGDVRDKDLHTANGLQVRGREGIKLLATGVSASLGLFGEAVAGQAEAVSFAQLHLGLTPKPWPWRTGSPRVRLRGNVSRTDPCRGR